MPASVEPTRSLPAVVVNKSRKVEPCSVLWDAGGDVTLCGESGLSGSLSCLICFSSTNSLFSEIKHLQNSNKIRCASTVQTKLVPYILER